MIVATEDRHDLMKRKEFQNVKPRNSNLIQDKSLDEKKEDDTCRPQMDRLRQLSSIAIPLNTGVERALRIMLHDEIFKEFVCRRVYDSQRSCE